MVLKRLQLADYDSLSHGNHNKALSKQLFEGGTYYDWVVTTSFYASLHFVKHIAFPGFKDDIFIDKKLHSQSFKSFDEYETAYCEDLKNNKIQKRRSKHNLMIKIAFKCIRDNGLAAKYKGLKDVSDTARYLQYQTSYAVAEKAFKDMELIAKKANEKSTQKNPSTNQNNTP